MDGNREHTVRFSLNGDSSDEAELLSRALQGAAGNRRGTDFLRFVVMRGWMEIIHGLSPKERIITLRSLGMSQGLIDEIEMRWPKPLLYQATEQSTLELQRSGATAAAAIATQAQSFSAAGRQPRPPVASAPKGAAAASRMLNALGEDKVAQAPAASAVLTPPVATVAEAVATGELESGGETKKVAVAKGARRSRLNADHAMF